MRFAFSDEQRQFQRSMRELCERECPPVAVRVAWLNDVTEEPTTTTPEARWAMLAELGVLGVALPEKFGGLGGSALDWILIVEEAGRAALPEPLVETAIVAAPLLAEVAPDWAPLSEVSAGKFLIAVGLDGNAAGATTSRPLIVDPYATNLVLLREGDALFAVAPPDAKFPPHPSVDGARRLFAVEWDRARATRLAENAGAALDAAFDRGALAAAAELCGLAARLLEFTVEYVKVRKQFGQPIGAFQAVKHQLADALVAVEFARPLVYRAADSTARALPDRAAHVSMAKAAASDAALKTSRAALQCHGAIGYSYEHDLHLFMKRAWALAAEWGGASWHRARVATQLLDGGGA